MTGWGGWVRGAILAGLSFWGGSWWADHRRPPNPFDEGSAIYAFTRDLHDENLSNWKRVWQTLDNYDYRLKALEGRDR